MSSHIQKLLLTVFLLTILLPAAAARYLGDPGDAPAIKNLISVLQVQSQELEKVLHMLSALQKEKTRLDKDKERLGKAMQRLKADQARLESGELSRKDFADKWQTEGHEQRLKKEYAAFQQSVNRFNQSIRAFNHIAKKMQHVLKKRNPAQIQALTTAMKDLIRKLQAALDEGHYERARFIARKSDVAKEFGYREK